MAALFQEADLRKDFLKGEALETIYFGGGTPSVLEPSQIGALITKGKEVFGFANAPEITLEANPDDLNLEYLKALKQAGITRLSIGLQSLEDDLLQLMNRSHNVAQGLEALKSARTAGFENISIDLIYGFPGLRDDQWAKALDRMVSLNPEHISTYCLTIEPGTVFANWARKGKIIPADEDTAARQFETMHEVLTQAGYNHYEVSNFSKPRYESRHNSGYWEDKKYLGLGPSAHSYDGSERYINISHNKKYIDAIEQGLVPTALDERTEADRANEYILTGLRTSKGLKFAKLNAIGFRFDKEALDYLKELEKRNYCKLEEERIVLTPGGLLLADGIAEALFFDNPD